MGNWGYNLYKWSYNPILVAGRGPPCKEVGYQDAKKNKIAYKKW